MLRKSLLLTLSALILAANNSCSAGGGGGGRTPTTPAVNATSVPSTVSPSITSTTPIQPSATKFEEPLTQEERPNPLQQFNSYRKIVKAIAINDYDYAYREFEAGGLKINSIKGESEFGDFPISSTVISLLQNIGFIGLNGRNLLNNTMSSDERKLAIDLLLRDALIFSARSNMNRLLLNNTTGIAQKDDLYSTNIAKDISTYFYGTENSTVAEGSIAQMAQTVDTENALQVKVFDTIADGITQMKATAKTNNTVVFINAKNKAETGLLKMSYMAVLQKLASAVSTKAPTDMAAAEFNYIAIRNMAISRNNIASTRVETIIGNKSFDRLNYAEMESSMSLGFREKALNEMSNAIANMTKNPNSAQNSALLAQMLLDITNSAYENRKFIKTPDKGLADNTQNFVNAVLSQNSTLALQSQANITAYVNANAVK